MQTYFEGKYTPSKHTDDHKSQKTEYKSPYILARLMGTSKSGPTGIYQYLSRNPVKIHIITPVNPLHAQSKKESWCQSVEKSGLPEII